MQGTLGTVKGRYWVTPGKYYVILETSEYIYLENSPSQLNGYLGNSSILE
jgi:hypothetical protein